MREGIVALGLIGGLIVTIVAIYNISSGVPVDEVRWPFGSGIKFHSPKPERTVTVTTPEPTVTITVTTTPTNQRSGEQPSSTEVPTLVPSTERPSSEKVILDYYDNINKGLYQAAWDRLPTTLQQNKHAHPNGFDSFEAWWNSINSVDVKEIHVKDSNSDNAEVNVRIGYNFKNGESGSDSLSFLLSWDAEQNKWRITEIKKN